MNDKHTSIVLIIIWLIIFTHSSYKAYVDEIEFSGFPSKFVAFIVYCINNNISLEFISPIPLLIDIKINSDLPETVRTLMSTESYFPNLVILYFILNYITGLSPYKLMLLPVGSIFLPTIYLSVMKAFLGKQNPICITVLVFIFGMLYFIIRRSCLTMFYVAPIGFLLLFTVVYCIKKICDDHERSTQTPYKLIMILCFFSLCQYWHSLLFFSLFFILSLSGTLFVFIALFQHIRVETIYKNNTIFRVSFICLVITIGFNHLWQSQYLSLFMSDLNIYTIIDSIVERMKGGTPFPIPYLYDYTSSQWGNIFHLSLLSSYLVLMVLFIYILFTYIKSKFSIMGIMDLKERDLFIFSISVLLAEIIQIIAYLSSQSILPFYIFLYPILIMGLILKLDDKKLFNIATILLILIVTLNLTCVVSLHFTNELGRTPITKYENTENNFMWAYQHLDRNKIIITDFNILHKYFQREAAITLKFNYTLLTPDIYAVIIGDDDDHRAIGANYIVIDRGALINHFPIDIRGSRGFLLIPKWNEINAREELNKLYEDKYVSIFLMNT